MTTTFNDAASTADAAADNRPQWIRDWDVLVEHVGEDFGQAATVWGADVVEPGAIRRYLEPLDLDSAIHYSAEAARNAGYSGIIAPYTGYLSWAIPAMRNPGEEALFESPERDSQPARSPINNEEPYPGPKTSGFFTASMDIDFNRPVVVGERLGNRGRRLISCIPKETSVGRGAFMSWENDIISDSGDVVAVVRNVVYAYNPVTKSETESAGGAA
jgi:hypothetical protein